MSRKCHAPGFQFDHRLNWQVWAYQIAALIKESFKIKGKDITRLKKELKQKI